mmetsp:Transcript_898/g.2187  ORF Transcript_898/g.2187 Transcript_898/m.2187 type:complete len:201 (+) Transcript_898:482-1084(+)
MASSLLPRCGPRASRAVTYICTSAATSPRARTRSRCASPNPRLTSRLPRPAPPLCGKVLPYHQQRPRKRYSVTCRRRSLRIRWHAHIQGRARVLVRRTFRAFEGSRGAAFRVAFPGQQCGYLRFREPRCTREGSGLSYHTRACGSSRPLICPSSAPGQWTSWDGNPPLQWWVLQGVLSKGPQGLRNGAGGEDAKGRVCFW